MNFIIGIIGLVLVLTQIFTPDPWQGGFMLGVALVLFALAGSERYS